jgi:Mrp family chromosome partitioning ATPase/capsular polysaccharide biosynthesis protein
MRVVVRSLVRWAWILAVCLVVGWLVGKQLANALPPTYQATAVVHLDAQARASSASAPVVQSVAAYATMVTADSILGTVLVHYPDLKRLTLSRQIAATPDLNGQNIMLAVTLPRPKVAANLANDLARLLVTQQNAAIKQGYEKQIKLLNNTIVAEQKQIDGLNQKIVQIPATSTTLIQQYQDQRNQIQTLQNQNVTARDNLLTQQALYSEPLSVIQTATAPNKPSTLLGMIPLVPITMLLLLILGGVLIFFLEQWADRINSLYALQKKVILPIFGALRWCSNPTPHEIPLRVFCELKHPYVEECRVMMADILFQAEAAQAHILAVTALKPHAGTSTVACQLAILLAQSKRRVLLIDANLHHPSLHERLEVSNEAGLARLLEEARMMKVAVPSPTTNSGVISLIDSLPIDNFIAPTPLPNLFLLPAGRPSVNPTNLLSMPEMEQFLKWATTRSDYVIIDCPSLTFAEVHILGSLSDQAFVVVDSTRDRLKQVAELKSELMSSGVKLTGLIMNKLSRWI